MFSREGFGWVGGFEGRFSVEGFGWVGGFEGRFSVEGFGWASQGGLRDSCVFQREVWVCRGF